MVRVLLILLLLVIACEKPTSVVEVQSDTASAPLITEATPVSVSNEPPREATRDTVDYAVARFFPIGARYRVIATQGITLHAAPDSASASYNHIPYGTEIEVLEKSKPDTIREMVSGNRVPGIWVRVKEGKHEGYVFSSGVMTVENTGSANDVHFFLTGEHCSSNYEYNPHYNYYGIFRGEQDHLLRKVQPAFYVRHEIPQGVDIWEWFHIETDLGGKPRFLFGLPQKLEERNIASYDFSDYDPYSESDAPEPVTVGDYIISIIRVGNEHEWKVPHIAITNKQGKELQRFIGSYIFFCGDVDQDGKPDLMYLDTNEKEGGYVLALTSYARPGEYIRAVGYYQLGYCC